MGTSKNILLNVINGFYVRRCVLSLARSLNVSITHKKQFMSPDLTYCAVFCLQVQKLGDARGERSVFP